MAAYEFGRWQFYFFDKDNHNDRMDDATVESWNSDDRQLCVVEVDALMVVWDTLFLDPR
jgi:hypothetical protein